jgi:hypothetical protein
VSVLGVARIAVALTALLAFAACDAIEAERVSKQLKDGLRAAIQRGKSPFLWSDVLPGRWTEICFFGAYDNGDHLKLDLTYETAWWLVVFDGERIAAKLNGVDVPKEEPRLNRHNATRTCFAPTARVTIVSGAELRFEDGRPWASKKK